MLFLLFSLVMVILILAIMFLCLVLPYWSSTYYKSTRKSFFELNQDTGAYGEYLCYLQLKSYEREGARFLFNCYLPREKDDTTEIDVMMISHSGIFVLESKNYSGWIFGSETRKNWTQSLPNRRGSIKNHFYNPIMQNRNHIKWLRKQVDESVPLHSLVVFSERCEFMDVSFNSEDVKVIKRNYLQKSVQHIMNAVGTKLDEKQIEDIYNKLLPYTQVSAEVKEQHVAKIKGEDIKPQQPKETEPSVTYESKPCPVCGGTLVVKTVTEGPSAGHRYYGCSNPNCTCVMALPENSG